MNIYKKIVLIGICAGSASLTWGVQPSATKLSQKVTPNSVISAYTDNLVIPTYTEMGDNALKFAKVAEDLKVNPTDERVAEACKLLLKTREPWELSESFLFGPAGFANLDPKLDSWPLDASQIDVIAKNADQKSIEIDATYVRNSLGAELRGFHAAEYLLFRDGLPRKASDLTPGQLAYLSAVAHVIAEDAVSLEAWWKGADKLSEEKAQLLEEAEIEIGKAYSEEFKKAGKPGSRYESVTEVMDEIIGGSKDIIDEIADSKIGKPYETSAVEDCESFYSRTSLIDARHNVQSVEKSYNVISPLVAARSAKTDKTVKNSIEKILKNIDSLKASLAESLDKKEALKAIIDSCKELSANLDKVQELLVK